MMRRRRVPRIAMLPRRPIAIAIATAALTSLVAGMAAGSRAADPTGLTDVGAGISVRQPASWHRVAPPISGLSYPGERLLLTSYPTSAGGGCGPDRAIKDLPASGALIYLLEYRPSVGDPWRGLRRSSFPPRPAHFALRRSALGHYECVVGVPSYLIRFRDADRPFQLHVALGPRATPARRAQVLRVLDSLRFEPLPAPPPDPFAGWRWQTEELGDSLRVPPGWSAGATTSPRRYLRPRSLLFVSSARLRSLPPVAKRAPHRLPDRIPAGDLAPDGVLLWIREERNGPATPDFPARPNGAWPGPADFHPVDRGPGLRWERAGTHSGGHRFSIWIASGPAASDADRALARKAATTFGFTTGSYRDRPCRRACRTG
jgi:hypothetical protein